MQPPLERKSLSTRVAERALLDRDQLLALVEELHNLVINRQQTVDRQSAAIARLQARNGPEAPATPANEPAPRRHAASVPGADFTIVFDGGALGNPGQGYGSYQIVGPGGVVAERSLQYGDHVTNNQAEFRTFIHALEDLQARQGNQARQTRVAIRGDSQLVINTIAGTWQARHPGLIPLHQQAVALLREFGRTDIKWQPRSESVAILGH